MIIGSSVAGPVAAIALAERLGARSELFAQVDGRNWLALVDAERVEQPDWSFTPARPLFECGRVGPRAGPWLFCVGLWAPHAARDEFLAWYADEHLPMLLECRTWDGCRFVETPDARGCQFHALHQLSDRAALDSSERERSRGTPWFRKLKAHDWFDEPFTRTLYRRLGDVP